ncbi:MULTISPECIES: hypothetical protein [Rhodococcus]|uniref:hypothetical protein n=1 Tax=Nocardiaceae TaxID=85025 RepID=UPI0012D3543E|nr:MULTISPECIES: hypothetical protein [Rhodococcus]
MVRYQLRHSPEYCVLPLMRLLERSYTIGRSSNKSPGAAGTESSITDRTHAQEIS